MDMMTAMMKRAHPDESEDKPPSDLVACMRDLIEALHAGGRALGMAPDKDRATTAEKSSHEASVRDAAESAAEAFRAGIVCYEAEAGKAEKE